MTAPVIPEAVRVAARECWLQREAYRIGWRVARLETAAPVPILAYPWPTFTAPGRAPESVKVEGRDERCVINHGGMILAVDGEGNQVQWDGPLTWTPRYMRAAAKLLALTADPVAATYRVTTTDGVTFAAEPVTGGGES